jgi:hypothetical protein
VRCFSALAASQLQTIHLYRAILKHDSRFV